MNTINTNEEEAQRLAHLYIAALKAGEEAAIAEAEAALIALGEAEADAQAVAAAEKKAAAKAAARERTEARRQRVRDGGCPMCGGTGYRPKFSHIYGGICFRCDGKG